MVIRKKENYFYAHNGAVLKSEKDMLDWMRTVNDEDFAYHINGDKNDFVPWVKKILKDATLAKNMEGLTSREELVKVVDKRIIFKNRKTKKGLISQIKEAVGI